MAILRAHAPYYEEIFRINGFLADPLLVFGFQDMLLGDRPAPFSQRLKRVLSILGSPNARGGFFRCLQELNLINIGLNAPLSQDFLQSTHLGELLNKRGCKDIHTLDLFDPRATMRYDMNLPVPPLEHNRFHAVMDIGSLEHVFDTRQCLENCLRMVRLGGFYFVHTCVNGYFRHGLHVFNPQGLVSALELNGFEVVYHRYSTERGIPLAEPVAYDDVVIWLVARKMKEMGPFIIPQQTEWRNFY